MDRKRRGGGSASSISRQSVSDRFQFEPDDRSKAVYQADRYRRRTIRKRSFLFVGVVALQEEYGGPLMGSGNTASTFEHVGVGDSYSTYLVLGRGRYVKSNMHCPHEGGYDQRSAVNTRQGQGSKDPESMSSYSTSTLVLYISKYDLQLIT